MKQDSYVRVGPILGYFLGIYSAVQRWYVLFGPHVAQISQHTLPLAYIRQTCSGFEATAVSQNQMSCIGNCKYEQHMDQTFISMFGKFSWLIQSTFPNSSNTYQCLVNEWIGQPCDIYVLYLLLCQCMTLLVQ